MKTLINILIIVICFLAYHSVHTLRIYTVTGEWEFNHFKYYLETNNIYESIFVVCFTVMLVVYRAKKEKRKDVDCFNGKLN